ncbi:MAG: addiction module protein [Burkholderiaceae bacterium]
MLDSLEAVDAAAVTNAWRGEIRQRKADILAGRAKLIPWNEARALILAL